MQRKDQARLPGDLPSAHGGVENPVTAAVERSWRLQYANLAEAQAAADETIELARSQGHLDALAHGYFHSAYVSIRGGALAAALTAIQESLRLFTELADQRGLWLVRTMAALQMRPADPAKAIEALVLLDANPPATATSRDRFVVDMALALSYRFVGDLEPALKWHYRAVASARASEEPQLIGAALCNLGGYHADLHNPEEACRLLEEALEWSSSVRADRIVVVIALNLTQTCAALGLHEKALYYAETYLKPIDPSHYADTSALLTLALSHANVGQADAAVEVFARARRGHVGRPDQATPQVFEAYVEARVALASGHVDRAVAIGLALFDAVDESAVGSPADLMHLHATVAEAYESLGEGLPALFHERSRGRIRERLVRRAAHAASVTHAIRSELEFSRKENDRLLSQHEALEAEHQQLAALNATLSLQVAENARLQDELREQNYRDALTDLHNRRFFYEHGPAVLEFALLANIPVCLVMLDIDHFKTINDSHGHGVGDLVLAGLGKLLRRSLRDEDVVCRVGGEEFALILPSSTGAIAAKRLRAILSAFGKMKPRAGGLERPIRLAFSAGIIEAPANGTTLEALMAEADKLMYVAKQRGRGLVVLGGEGSPVEREPQPVTGRVAASKPLQRSPRPRRH